MRFNFQQFTVFALQAYQHVKCSTRTCYGITYTPSVYSIDDMLQVFAWYFQTFESSTGRVHPNLRTPQIAKIIEVMPACELSDANHIGLNPDDYKALIEQHFKTAYNVGRGGCDYNINHFFSGDIRALRYYETAKGDY